MAILCCWCMGIGENLSFFASCEWSEVDWNVCFVLETALCVVSVAAKASFGTNGHGCFDMAHYSPVPRGGLEHVDKISVLSSMVVRKRTIYQFLTTLQFKIFRWYKCVTVASINTYSHAESCYLTLMGRVHNHPSIVLVSITLFWSTKHHNTSKSTVCIAVSMCIYWFC